MRKLLLTIFILMIVPTAPAADKQIFYGGVEGERLKMTGAITGLSNVVFSSVASTTNAISSTDNECALVVNLGGGPFKLPTVKAGLQYCFINYTAISSALIAYTYAAGQSVIYSGVSSASGGRLKTAGALGDGFCVMGLSTTEWMAWCSAGVCSLD